MLHGDAAVQGANALDIARGNCFGMVDEPMQAIERDVGVDLFVDIENARDAFVVCCMDTEWPALFHQQPHHLLQLGFQLRRQLRARLAELFEVCSGKYQHLAGAVVTQQVIALA